MGLRRRTFKTSMSSRRKAGANTEETPKTKRSKKSKKDMGGGSMDAENVEVVMPTSAGEGSPSISVVMDGKGSNQENVMEVDKKDKWKSWTVRTIVTIAMIIFFFAIVGGGPVPVTITIVILQVWAFNEVTNITYGWGQEKDLPYFRTNMWYFLFVMMYYLWCKPIVAFLGFDSLVHYHSFATFVLYIIGFVTFVFNLQQPLYKYQILQFGWVHMALIGVVCSSYIIAVNLLQGLVWFVLPASLIITNDIFAYIFGFFYGRTQLIAISPKKTVEGFLGALGSTFVWAIFATLVVSRFDHFICPSTYSTGIHYGCVHNPVFEPALYTLPPQLHFFAASFMIRPIVFHALVFAAFASLICPFGGFFASGIKRAFKIKDFGALFPGHGGVVDRVDCQFLMGVFTYVYYTNFIKLMSLDVETIIASIQALSSVERAQVCASTCGAAL